MKKCEHCGHINEDIFKVCARCGRGLQSKPNMTENEYQQQKKESVTKSEIETLSNEELKKAIESKIFSEKEAEFAKDILIKREAFAKFPDSELKKCITMDMYDIVFCFACFWSLLHTLLHRDINFLLNFIAVLLLFCCNKSIKK